MLLWIYRCLWIFTTYVRWVKSIVLQPCYVQSQIVCLWYLGFFDQAATKRIARFWLWKLLEGQLQEIPATFKGRIIAVFLGERDRRPNRPASHLHKANNLLVEYWNHLLSTTQRSNIDSQWIIGVRNVLNVCNICHSNDEPLRNSMREMNLCQGSMPVGEWGDD